MKKQSIIVFLGMFLFSALALATPDTKEELSLLSGKFEQTSGDSQICPDSLDVYLNFLPTQLGLHGSLSFEYNLTSPFASGTVYFSDVNEGEQSDIPSGSNFIHISDTRTQDSSVVRDYKLYEKKADTYVLLRHVVYRWKVSKKGRASFVVEVLKDRTDLPQTSPEFVCRYKKVN